MDRLSEEEKKAIDYYENNEYSFGFEADFDIENFKKTIGIEETDEDTFERHQIRFKTLLNLIERQQKELEQEKTKSNNYKELIIKALAINNKVLNAKEKPENYEEILGLNIEILRVREIAEDVLGRS